MPALHHGVLNLKVPSAITLLLSRNHRVSSRQFSINGLHDPVHLALSRFQSIHVHVEKNLQLIAAPLEREISIEQPRHRVKIDAM